MRTTKVTCDVCGAEKRETNHWYEVAFIADHLSVEIGYSGFLSSVTPLGKRDVLDACGKPCAIRLISERLK
jgi:hypothetical protein